MQTLLRTITLFIGLTLLSTPVFAETVLAEVNGQKITQQDIDLFKQFLSKNSNTKIPSDDKLLEELIKREVIYQEAIKNKIDKNPEVAYVIEQQQRSIIIQAQVQSSGAANIAEQDIQELYQQVIASQSRSEYNIKQIQVATEAEAKELIKQLNNGANFEELAKQKSIDPSGKDGGSIGWLSAAQLQGLPNMLAVLDTMKKDGYSATAVQTEHGWHILKLVDSRETAPTSYEQLKPQLSQMIQSRRLNAYIEKLRKDANIKINKK